MLGVKQTWSGRWPMSSFDPGCVKTPMSNLRVELPFRFSSIWESIVLPTSSGRRQLRKQFCASFAQARFHTAWTHRRHRPHSYCFPNCCGLRGQTQGPHHSNLISARPINARWVVFWDAARFVSVVALVDKPGHRWDSWTRRRRPHTGRQCRRMRPGTLPWSDNRSHELLERHW